jgi:hypothetical protein
MSPRREKADTSMISEYARDGFSLSNPIADPDYYSVPKLLRRVADHLDELGDDVTVHDLRLDWEEYKDPETYVCYEQLWPTIAVNWPDRSEAPPKPADSFSINCEGESGRGGVPKLLRRIADNLDELGNDVAVSSLIMHTEPDSEGLSPSANTYYSREEGWVRNFDPQTHELLLEWERYYADSQNHETDEE